jgi:deoxyribonuclease V
MNLEQRARIQRNLSQQLKPEPLTEKITLVGGIDCSYDLQQGKICAATVVLTFPELELVENTHAIRPLVMPYIPGYLNFREGPVCIQALKKIRRQPQILMADGNGIAHPRRMGLASYLGVTLGIPTVGCAKSPFYPFTPPGTEKGEYTAYLNKNRENVGTCLRTRTGVKPIFVSPGHLTDIPTSRSIVLACSRTRIPEPLRFAHHMASRIFKTA